MFVCVLFFKQKAAYEMRIIDWSSDVCSSDREIVRRRQVLQHFIPANLRYPEARRARNFGVICRLAPGPGAMGGKNGIEAERLWRLHPHQSRPVDVDAVANDGVDHRQHRNGPIRGPQRLKQTRSEEHTSELQSLMRISYAVFCLKK